MDGTGAADECTTLGPGNNDSNPRPSARRFSGAFCSTFSPCFSSGFTAVFAAAPLVILYSFRIPSIAPIQISARTSTLDSHSQTRYPIPPEKTTPALSTFATPHLVFETLAYAVGFRLYLILRRRFGDPIPLPLRWAVLAAAVAGAAFGSKLLYWFEDPQLTLSNLHNPAYFIGGKTIVGALAGGLIAVELMKVFIGLRQSTGDLYAIPLAAAIAIGRIGCFLTGLPDNTYGTPTRLPWAVNFGDGIPRHPTQIYEMMFLFALIPFLYRAMKAIALNKSVTRDRTVILSGAPSSRSEDDAQSKDPLSPNTGRDPGRHPHRAILPGDAFKLFMVAYMSFRLLCDFIKPYPRIFLSLGAIQWICVLTLVYYSHDIFRWLGSTTPRLSAEAVESSGNRDSAA